MNQEKMGKLISNCRKELHLTQAQIAEKLGVTDKTVSKWENGTNAPNISLLNSLSDLLGISTNELLNGEKNDYPVEENKKEVDIPSVIQYYVGINDKKTKRKMSLVVTILVLLFIAVVSILILKNNYDNCYVYQITSMDSDFDVNGFLILTEEKDILSINSVTNVSRYDLYNQNGIDFETSLVSNKTELQKIGNILFHDNSKEYEKVLVNNYLKNVDFYITEDSDYNLLLDNSILVNNELSIKLKYIDDSDTERVLLIPLKLEKIFSNNKFIYDGGTQF